MKMIQHLLLYGMLLSSCASAQKSDSKDVLLSEQNVENAYPRLSKDGRSILYQSNRSGSWQLYVLDIASKQSVQLTKDAHNNFPDWDANNEWIAYVSDKDGNEEIYLMKRDGSGIKRLTNDAERDIHPYFSPDGKYLLFNSTRGNGSLDIYRITLADNKTERITDTKENETCARYSPDMKKIVFLQNDDVSDDIVVMEIATGLKTNITNDPGVRDGWPMFSNDGNWVYYSSMQDGPFNIFKVQTDGKNKKQLTKAFRGEEDARVYVAADGKTFVYNKKYGNTIEILRAVI
jgi:tol-pal system beta propeller repeat protein TolB